MKAIEVTHCPVTLIDPSPYQVRENFAPETLEELASSVREHGIIQPLTARSSPRDPERLELVAGERRLRAAKLAGLERVPVIVHDLDDGAAQEIVLIENLQREDLTVREEARGYRKVLDLRDAAGLPCYTQATLAAKIGKSISHIADRLKLLLCPESLVNAVESGEVALSTAMLVGRIPDAKLREAAARKVLTPEIQEVPLNYEQTREMVREHFMVSLQKPGFDIEAAELLPVVHDEITGERLMGGSCLDCPYLTDASNSESPPRNSVAGSRGTGTHALCTLPACHRKKQDAAWKILRGAAEAQNTRVIEGDGAREIFKGYRGSLTHDAGYVDLSAKPEYSELGQIAYENKKTWKQLLKGVDIDVVLARHPVSGQRIELVEKKQAIIIAKAQLHGRDADAEIKDANEAADIEKERRAKEIRAQKIEQHMVNEGLSDLVAAIERRGMGLEDLDYLFQIALEQSGADGMRSMRLWLDVKMPKGTVSCERDYEDAILTHVRARATTQAAWMGYLTAALLCKHIKYSGSKGEDFAELKTRFGVKDVELERRAAALLDAGKKVKKEEPPVQPAEVVTEMADSEFKNGPRSLDEWIGEQGEQLAAQLDASAALQDQRAEIKRTITEWRAENPGCGVAAVADALLISYDLAASICDELIDDQAPAEMSFEEQVGALVVGTHKMADIIGKTPAKEAPERKAWDARRLKLQRAVKQVEAA
jgi:ParB/RepB/Spo0J family partition protein